MANLPQIDLLLNGFGTDYANGTATAYLAGTTTLASWFTDAAGTTPAANPITLSASGKATVYCSARLRMDVKNSTGVSAPGFPIDNIGFSITAPDAWVQVADLGAKNDTTVNAAITAAGSTATTLYFEPGTWSITNNVTFPSNITVIRDNGAIFSISSGKVMTINGAFQSDINQAFSGLGSVVFGVTSVTAVYPEWFGDAVDNTDSTGTGKAAFDKALAASVHVNLRGRTYYYKGSMTTLSVTGRQLIGTGSSYCIVKFTDSTVKAGIEEAAATAGYEGMTIKGVQFQGPGISAGTTNNVGNTDSISDGIVGFWQHSTAFQSHCHLSDVRFNCWSGDGLVIRSWFNAKYENVHFQNIGGNGAVIGGDQSLTWINSGYQNYNVQGWQWWFIDGAPFLQGLNASGDAGMKYGARFGRESSDPLGGGVCTPIINGLNLEQLSLADAIGIQFENGSNFSSAQGIQIYLTAGVTADSGVKWVFSSATGLMTNGISFVMGAGASYTNGKWNMTSNGLGGGLIVATERDLSAEFGAAADNALCIGTLAPFAGYLKSSMPYKAPLVNVTGKAVVNNNASGTYTIPADTTYVAFTGTNATTVAFTFPAAAAALDGRVITIYTVAAISVSTTWTSSGATFVDAPVTIGAKGTARFIYHHATTQWLPY